MWLVAALAALALGGLLFYFATTARKAEAEKTLRRALAIEPASADAHHALGLSLIRGKDIDKALPCCVRRRRAKPTSTPSHSTKPAM